MCQLNAFLVQNGQEELVREDVTLVEVEGERVFLTTLFQEREAVDARIQVVDLVDNKLLLETSGS